VPVLARLWQRGILRTRRRARPGSRRHRRHASGADAALARRAGRSHGQPPVAIRRAVNGMAGRHPAEESKMPRLRDSLISNSCFSLEKEKMANVFSVFCPANRKCLAHLKLNSYFSIKSKVNLNGAIRAERLR
jgi:hypothetical protein